MRSEETYHHGVFVDVRSHADRIVMGLWGEFGHAVGPCHERGQPAVVLPCSADKGIDIIYGSLPAGNQHPQDSDY